MPIRPERKALYPANWAWISAAIRKREGDRCKWCHVANGALGGRTAAGRFAAAHPTGLQWPKPGDWAWCSGRLYLRIVRIVLTVAHLDHNPANCDPANLAALCQRCHLNYDRASKRQRRQERERAGTEDLFP